jgi:autotransporter-associated beta strand protein
MSIDRLSGNGTVANTYNTDVVNTLTIGGNNGSSAFSGVMRGVGGGANNSSLDAGKINLVKTGSGAFTLTGANLYKGTTTVNGGTLLVNGSHASGAGAYNVSAGTLGGTGTVWSVVNVTGPGTLAPGGTNVTGRFTIQNDVALGPGAIFDVDIKGTTPGQASGGYDQLTLAAGKTLSLGAGVARLVVRVPRAVALPLGQTFTLATGGTPNGYFEGLADGAEVRTGEYRFIIHYGPDAAITLTSSKMDKGTLLLVW